MKKIVMFVLVLLLSGCVSMEDFGDRSLIGDLVEAESVLWVGPHCDDEIWASGFLALSSLGYGKKTYVVCLKDEPGAFPEGADKEDRFEDNADYAEFLGLEEYYMWHMNDYTGTERYVELENFLDEYISLREIDMFITFENTHGASGNTDHTKFSEWFTDYCDRKDLKLYYVLNLDPLLPGYSDGEIDPEPYTDVIDLHSEFVNNVSLWDMKYGVIEIYSTSVPGAKNIYEDEELIENLIPKEFYRIVN